MTAEQEENNLDNSCWWKWNLTEIERMKEFREEETVSLEEEQSDGCLQS